MGLFCEKISKEENSKARPVLGAVLFALGFVLLCPSLLFLLAAFLVGELLVGVLVSAPSIIISFLCFKVGRYYRPRKVNPVAADKPTTPTTTAISKAIQSNPVATVNLETSATPVVLEATQSKPVSVTSERIQRRSAVIESKKAVFDSNLAQIPRFPITLAESKSKRENMLNMPEIKYSNITRRTNFNKLFPFVVVDAETTGIKPGGNDIIEISAIKYGPGYEAISCFTTLCKPRKPIPADATAVNNITDEMVADAPPFSLVAPSLSEYIAGCNIVGHNLIFDLRFLFISGVTFPPKARYYDTLDLAKKVLTKYGERKYNHHTGEYEDVDDFDVLDYKLETLCEYYDIYRGTAHRSLSDCYATGLLFKNLIEYKTKDVVCDPPETSSAVADSVALPAAAQLSPEEKALEILKDIIPGEFTTERRSDDYLTLLNPSGNDFCRIKFTKRASWFSLDCWSGGDIKDDPLLAGVKNRNQRHWKINISGPSDLHTYAHIIAAVYNS